jgi:hypothetical protein
MRKTTMTKGIFAALLLVGGVAMSTAGQGKNATNAEFESNYPQFGTGGTSGTPSGSMAGVDVKAIGVPGMTLKVREDETADDRGVVLSFADGAGEVRVVIRFAVTPTSNDARSFLKRELHAVSLVLPEVKDSSLGDLAYAEGGVGEVYVAGTISNVAYVVRTIPNENAPGAVPTAKSIAADFHAKTVPGVFASPTPAVSIPSEVPMGVGAPITVGAIAGQAPHLRAENAYVAHGSTGPVLKPFGPGKVAVIAVVADDLGRVGVARAEAIAR